MSDKFVSGTKKNQDLITLYSQLDNMLNRSQWHFESEYKDRNTCAFVFAHTTGDASVRYENLNALANILHHAGIKSSIIARDGLISDVVIAPEYTNLARKMFAKYQSGNRNIAKAYDAALEQEWLRQRQK